MPDVILRRCEAPKVQETIMAGLRWRPFEFGGEVHDLSHLHPFDFEFVVAAKDGKPEQCYKINAIFSLHCFTRGCQKGEVVPQALLYADDREERVWDMQRYALSHQLPDIVRSLGERKCFHAKHANFVTVEVLNEDGERHEYSVFFTVSKAGKGRGLNLFVQSAYVADQIPKPTKRKPIRFRVIAHNTVAGRPIKPPPGRRG